MRCDVTAETEGEINQNIQKDNSRFAQLVLAAGGYKIPSSCSLIDARHFELQTARKRKK